MRSRRTGRASRVTLNLSFTLSLVTITTADLEISLAALDFEPEILCTCKGFCSTEDHSAMWWITLSCGCCYPFCQRALSMANLRLKLRTLDCRKCGAEPVSYTHLTLPTKRIV